MPPRDPEIDDLLRRFSGLVKAAAVRVCGAHGLQLAADVSQQVFVNSWRQLDREQTIADPRSYIYKCAVRETVRLLRLEARQPGEGLDDGVVELFDAQALPEGEAVARDTAEAVAAALDTLAPERRRAVEAHIQGYEVADIMRMYDWPYERARHLTARGKADLRAALAARGIDG